MSAADAMAERSAPAMNDARLCSLVLSICRVVAVLTVVTTLFGVWRRHTGVPWWDMWNGYIEFYLRTRAGDLSAWWQQHNEHRLVLSELFFYADLRWFNGRLWLPVVGNLIVAGSIWWLLAYVWKRICPATLATSAARAVFWIIGVACFSWAQEENLPIAFQIQFFLACFLPLAAFAMLAFFAEETERVGRFAAAAVLGALSAGTMANGIAVPLMLFVFAVFLRLRLWQIVTLAVLAIAVPAIYLSGYATPEIHDSPVHAWTQTPVRALWFCCVFLGSALTQLRLGVALSGLVGLGLIVLLVSLGAKCLYNAKRSPWMAVLALVLAYAVLAGLATASGRTSMGLGAALAGRYATVSLLAMTAALMLVIANARSQRLVSGVLIAAALVCVGNVLVQARTLKDPALHNYPLRLGFLALSLNVNDAPALQVLFPDNARLRAIASYARADQIGLFGGWPFRDAQALVGKPASAVPHVQCDAVIVHRNPVLNENTQRVEGYLASSTSQTRDEVVLLLDAHDDIAGVALAGMPQADIQSAHANAVNGFVGYVVQGRTATHAMCAAAP